MESCSSPLGHGLGELWVTIAWIESLGMAHLHTARRRTRKKSDGVSVIHRGGSAGKIVISYSNKCKTRRMEMWYGA